MNKPLIHIKDVCFKYPESNNWILKDTNLVLNHGEKIGIIGDNGSGKSTITKLILGIEHPSKGNIYFENANIVWNNHYSEIGYIGDPSHSCEMQGLPTNMVIKNLIQILTEIYHKSVGKKRLNELCELLEINELYDKETQNLSTGERKRIMALLALSKPNKLLILDEPFDGLDRKIKKIMLNLLKHYLKSDISILYIAHNYMEIDLFTNKVYRIVDRKLEQEEQREFNAKICVDNVQKSYRKEKLGLFQHNLIELLESDNEYSEVKLDIYSKPKKSN